MRKKEMRVGTNILKSVAMAVGRARRVERSRRITRS